MVMDREKLTAGAFAESIGVAQATISHILGPRNKYPSTEVILRLHQRYNDINLEWLLTGKGNMSNNPEFTLGVGRHTDLRGVLDNNGDTGERYGTSFVDHTALIRYRPAAALDGLQARRIRLSRAGGKCKSREHQADGDQIYGLLHDLRVVTV